MYNRQRFLKVGEIVWVNGFSSSIQTVCFNITRCLRYLNRIYGLSPEEIFYYILYVKTIFGVK